MLGAEKTRDLVVEAARCVFANDNAAFFDFAQGGVLPVLYDTVWTEDEQASLGAIQCDT